MIKDASLSITTSRDCLATVVALSSAVEWSRHTNDRKWEIYLSLAVAIGMTKR